MSNSELLVIFGVDFGNLDCGFHCALYGFPGFRYPDHLTLNLGCATREDGDIVVIQQCVQIS